MHLHSSSLVGLTSWWFAHYHWWWSNHQIPTLTGKANDRKHSTHNRACTCTCSFKHVHILKEIPNRTLSHCLHLTNVQTSASSWHFTSSFGPRCNRRHRSDYMYVHTHMYKTHTQKKIIVCKLDKNKVNFRWYEDTFCPSPSTIKHTLLCIDVGINLFCLFQDILLKSGQTSKSKSLLGGGGGAAKKKIWESRRSVPLGEKPIHESTVTNPSLWSPWSWWALVPVS